MNLAVSNAETKAYSYEVFVHYLKSM